MNTASAESASGGYPEREACECALMELRRNIGCTKERLARYESLVRVLRQRLAREGKPATIEACLAELSDAVHDLSDPKHREPLLVALRFHPRYQQENLTKRREHFNEDQGIVRHRVDLRTLERRENSAISTLVQVLLEDGSEDPASEVLESARPGWMRALQVVSRESWYTFGPNRVVREGLIALHFVALESGIHSYLAHSEYYQDRRPGVIDISPEFGCELDGEPTFEDDRTYMRLRVPQHLDKGDIHSLVYRVRVRSEEPCRPLFLTVAGGNEREMVKHIEFCPDAVPDRIWSFANLPLPATYESENLRQRLLPGGASRFVGDHWSELRLGMCSGICWDWPEVPGSIPG